MLPVVAATIEIRNGSTTGVCVWSTPFNAICSFDSGTGRRTFVVTANADQSVCYWGGPYWFGHHHGHGYG